MSFRIRGLDPAPFVPLYGLADEALARRGVRRMTVDRSPGFPDRITMRDLDPGETALLLNFEHQPAASPYRSAHAIFVQEGAALRFEAVDAVPDVLRRRTLSLRAFDREGDMRDADLVEGDEAEASIQRLLGDPQTTYLHAHYAKRGCYAALIERA